MLSASSLRRRDAVMTYVSLFERTVHVLPDHAIASKLGAHVLDGVCTAITAKAARPYVHG